MVNTSCWSWSLFSLNVGVGNYLHIMLELVIVYTHVGVGHVYTSGWSWSLLKPHFGVDYIVNTSCWSWSHC